MSLATRCPACGTVFRVVQDQLKVSGGWVRCGQCHEVFNGLQTLFELPADPPAEPPVPTAPAPGPAAGLFMTREAPAPSPSPAPDTWEATEPAAMDDAPAAGEPMVDLADLPQGSATLIDADAPPATNLRASVWAYTPRLAEVDEASEAETVMPEEAADFDQEALAEPEAAPVAEQTEVALQLPSDAGASAPAQSFVISQPPTLPAHWQGSTSAAAVDSMSAPQAMELGSTGSPDGPEEPVAPAADTAPNPEADEAATWPPQRRRKKRQRKPAFMREAERAARWRSPGVRAVLGGASFILGLMLALQVTHHLRDELAARWPATRGALAAWCQVTNCQLKAPRTLSAITLDSSALSRTARGQVLRFEAELRNSASHAVMAPALDVSFTDNLGHQLVRKVLLPEQLGASPGGLPAHQTWRIDVPLQVGDLPIAGFTAEVFYP